MIMILRLNTSSDARKNWTARRTTLEKTAAIWTAPMDSSPIKWLSCLNGDFLLRVFLFVIGLYIKGLFNWTGLRSAARAAKKENSYSFSADSLNTFHRPADSLKKFPYSPRIRFFPENRCITYSFTFFLFLSRLSGNCALPYTLKIWLLYSSIALGMIAKSSSPFSFLLRE